jgi:hypothetical protein
VFGRLLFGFPACQFCCQLAVRKDPREPLLPDSGSSRLVVVLQAMIQFEELFVVFVEFSKLGQTKIARSETLADT